MSETGSTSKTVLSRSFSFWFSFFKQSLTKAQKDNVAYEDTIKNICTFNTVEEFWGYYQHMIRPEQLPVGCEFFLFQKGIKPMWEDSLNMNGGRFVLRIKKDYGNKFWEDLLLSFIGECKEDSENICGLVVTVKEREIVISIWIKEITPDQREFIKVWIRDALDLNESIDIEYRDHPKSNPGESHDNKTHGEKKNFQYEVKKPKEEIDSK